jgi:hypothetical protein
MYSFGFSLYLRFSRVGNPGEVWQRGSEAQRLSWCDSKLGDVVSLRHVGACAVARANALLNLHESTHDVSPEYTRRSRSA